MYFYKRIQVWQGRWIGFSLQYDKDFIDRLKKLPMRVYDATGRIWWVPEAHAGIVLSDALNCGLLSQEEVDAFYQDSARKDVVAGAEHFAQLGLLQGAPKDLVEIVYKYWKRKTQIQGGLDVAGIDAAYEEIMRVGEVDIGG